MTVSLSTTSLTIGATSQATAVAKDSKGVVISGKYATWSVSNTALASVSSSGLVSGLAAGTVTVTATIDGIKSSAASLTISGSTAPTNPPLPPPSGSTVVKLPLKYLNYSFPSKTGQTIVVGRWREPAERVEQRAAR